MVSMLWRLRARDRHFASELVSFFARRASYVLNKKKGSPETQLQGPGECGPAMPQHVFGNSSVSALQNVEEATRPRRNGLNFASNPADLRVYVFRHPIRRALKASSRASLQAISLNAPGHVGAGL